ncbi:DUF484 family protein [Thalassomonas viridans]|uniref:DUF484 family protein n=1 Tax=Thalassomonas viridans TaxID=137584 RepID=A0AAE9Z3Q2_9GAMM|nr:DUF484 family protein [Thalassomonas viridans]WDE05495.1 DUF484 family protein [Thalassomonas viridans]
MSENKVVQANALTLTDELVADYLLENPEFFNRAPHVLTGLRLADPHRGTVSLVERQQQLLRQKVQGLEEEITQLMSVANHNERLFMLYSDLYLRLIDCRSAEELLDCLHRATTELLSLSQLKLWLTGEFSLNHASLSDNDCGGILQNRLADEDYYFGRLQQSEQQLIFSGPIQGSVVLIKLCHEQQTLGFLAISSDDAEHFDPRMDTLLLGQFRKLVAKLLLQHLTRD